MRSVYKTLNLLLNLKLAQVYQYNFQISSRNVITISITLFRKCIDSSKYSVCRKYCIRCIITFHGCDKHIFVKFYDVIILYSSSMLSIIWGFLNDFSFMLILSYISISLPGLPQILQQILLNIIQIDILQSNNWSP